MLLTAQSDCIYIYTDNKKYSQVVRDEDLAKQVGKYIYFDLVDYDKVRSFHVQKQMSFNIFKVCKIRGNLNLVN
jgi:hypothetical protein